MRQREPAVAGRGGWVRESGDMLSPPGKFEFELVPGNAFEISILYDSHYNISQESND